ncbi:hypothetical protein C0995_013319 [Termitomyces sp. Mi166|nr:hypothetical protein C0995_013319 [Termitomyces sp. Mi166\
MNPDSGLISQSSVDFKANGEICQAEFTRSDLLTRHKRTCGDSTSVNRSRRKSCQACAESKVKCNLEYPCSKCTSRGRECIFINDPEVSRNKKLASESKRKLSLFAESSTSTGNAAPLSASTSSLYSESTTDSPTDLSSAFPSFSPATSVSSDSPLSFAPPLSVSPESSSSSSSSQSSPRPGFLESQAEMATPFDMSFDALSLDPYLQGTYAGEMYFDPMMAACSSIQDSTTDFWLEGSELFPNLSHSTFVDDQFGFPSAHGSDEQVFTADFSTLMSAENITDTSPRTSAYQSLGMETAVNLFDGPSAQPASSADLDLYRTSSRSVPLVHAPTWAMEGKHLLLVRAMQACGALFVRTTTAVAFIDEILSSTRDALLLEFAKLCNDPREQNHLLLTLVLLQTIGLFHQKADQRISSNVYHGMLVMMIRRTGVIPRVNAWVPSDTGDFGSLDTAWREWANYEMIKRLIFLSYLHDCCHCMYFAIPPSFQPSELDICLPCDDALWSATDAAQWFNVSQTPSSYGVGNSRILGFPMQTALAMLSETHLSTVTLALNPFAHFILIHTILRNIYVSYPGSLSVDPSVSPLVVTGGDVIAVTNSSVAGKNHDNFVIQYALHNWLQTWLGSPESMSVEESAEEPPFIRNALPFYWLAQVSLLAIQDGSVVFGGQTSDAEVERKFRLMKQWLIRIRAFLRSGNMVPTFLWDELTNAQAQVLIEEVQDEGENTDGLFAFFLGSKN